MAIETLISWNAPEHLQNEKSNDWYWVVGIITLALIAVCIIFGQFITALFFLVAVSVLVLHASYPPRIIHYEINDRGIVADDKLFPFLSVDSFWIPHDIWPPRILVKSRKILMPLMVIFIDQVDPEEVREILLHYIAEKEHREPLFKLLLERWGF